MIRALASSPLGFLVGLSLGALGSGGSILAVPVLVYAAGQSPQEATATSLLLVAVSAVAGLPRHLRAGRVNIAHGVAFGAAGIGGSFAGTALNRAIAPDLLLLGFSALILVAAWRMLRACPTCTRTGEDEALAAGSGAAGPRALDARRIAAIALAGTGVGFLTGLFGVGGGFVIVPALTLLLGYPMPRAIGTSLLIVAINALIALAARIGGASIDWVIATAFTLTAVAGVAAGGHLADRMDARKSLRVFAGALVLLALLTAGSTLRNLL